MLRLAAALFADLSQMLSESIDKRALSATRKRHAHKLANAQSTSVQNEQGKRVQNETLRNAK
jgi:hypothetical protein